MCLPKAELIFEQRRAFAQSSHTSVVESSACASVQMAASTLARTCLGVGVGFGLWLGLWLG